MKIISYDTVVKEVSKLVAETNYNLPQDVRKGIEHQRERETIPLVASILDQIIENFHIASSDCLPLCQDTGIAVFFAEVGDNVSVDGDGLGSAINEGTRKGYRDGALRMSVVRDPLNRVNTGDNTPAVIHYTVIPGETLSLVFCPKGAGCENMSRTAMLNPGDGRDGVVNFILDTVRAADGKPCPPVIVGVGLGGDFEYSALLSKRALLRTLGSRHPDQFYADLETELLRKINELGIGPMGLGGDSTALDIFIETAPCHIASLPAAVNIQCHSARHGEIVF
ncbi:fumarate hydratase [bacterium]|nr:fumarate hydratase [bacterium]